MPSPTTDSLIIEVPTPSDFKGLAVMKAAAFAEKGVMNSDGGDSYDKYLKKYPDKIQRCRVAKRPPSSEGGPSEIMGAIQLQIKGDPGDFDLPAIMRHQAHSGEAYVEFIATHPNHTGKGVGSKLLQWAETYCRENSDIRYLSLEVMSANKDAIRLYERKGYVSKRNPHAEVCDDCCGPIFVFCCFGCKYCGVQYMENPLLPDEKESTPNRTNGERFL